MQSNIQLDFKYLTDNYVTSFPGSRIGRISNVNCTDAASTVKFLRVQSKSTQYTYRSHPSHHVLDGVSNRKSFMFFMSEKSICICEICVSFPPQKILVSTYSFFKNKTSIIISIFNLILVSSMFKTVIIEVD